MIIFPSQKSTLEYFGIEHFNINETASIICRCLACDGQIDIEEHIKDFPKDYISLFELEEEKFLKKHIEEFSERLVSAIKQGTLKPSIMSKDLDEKIDKEETYLDFSSVFDWLVERGVELGDLYQDDYFGYVEETLKKIEELIDVEKATRRNPKIVKEAQDINRNEVILLLEENFKLKQEIEALKAGKRIKQITDKKLNPKRKDSLNKLVLSMAIKKYRYNPIASRNDSTANIESTLLEYGFTMDKNTIRDCLNQAYEDLKDEIIDPDSKTEIQTTKLKSV